MILAGMNVFVAFFVLLLLLADSTPPAAQAIPLIGELLINLYLLRPDRGAECCDKHVCLLSIMYLPFGENLVKISTVDPENWSPITKRKKSTEVKHIARWASMPRKPNKK